ncbi:hypothetical protein BDF19DRAFT_467856 [Syncephalis fuscata]|nr:hypothetical protein BDF19DRAFT_467856 [Syncephalis fuscata]
MSTLLSTPTVYNITAITGDTTLPVANAATASTAAIATTATTVATATATIATATTDALPSVAEVKHHTFGDYTGPVNPTALLITAERWTQVISASANTDTSSLPYGYFYLRAGQRLEHALENLVDALPLTVRHYIVRRVASDVPALRGQVCAEEACMAAHRLMLARRVPQVIRYTPATMIDITANSASNFDQEKISAINTDGAKMVHEMMCQIAHNSTTTPTITAIDEQQRGVVQLL